jgi:ABC-type lipoprotein export system ATPase subunit
MNIRFVFQSFNLIDELTTHENVELPFHDVEQDTLRYGYAFLLSKCSYLFTHTLNVTPNKNQKVTI